MSTTKEALDYYEIFLTTLLGKVERTEWRMYMLILGCNGLTFV